MSRRGPRLGGLWWRGVALGTACALAAWIASVTPFGRAVEDWFQDANFAYRGARSTAANVVIVAIDDDSLERLPKPLAAASPELAEVVTFLADRGAAAIGIDVFVPESLDHYDEDPGLGGAALGVAAFRAGNVVLPAVLGDRDRLVRPLATWRAAGAPLALVQSVEDEDRFVRRYQPAALADDPDGDGARVFSSLAMGMLNAAGRVENDGSGPRVDGRSLPPLDRQGALRINFVDRPETVRRVPFHRVLAAARGDDRPLADQHGRPVEWREALVVVGATAASLGDRHATPYANGAWWLPGLPPPRLMDGPEVQANALATLADGAFVTTPWWLATLPWCLIAGAGLGAAFARLSLSQGAILALAHHFGWKLASLGLFWLAGDRVEVLAMLATGALCYAATFALRWRRLRRMFGAVKSEAIARALEADPGHLRLKGEEREVTILFSDIRSFTSFAEAHTAPEVVALLNAYFGVVVPILEVHGATVDKYIGDGIMAIFNAPEPQPDHALHATRSAVAMVERVHALAATWASLGFPGMRIGVGLHTGPAVIGTIGSPRRLDYTAIGDTVNAAARIESENKPMGTEILISAATYAALPEAERLRLGCSDRADPASVKGKAQELLLHRVAVGPEAGGPG